MAIDLGTINYSINVDTSDLDRAADATVEYTQAARESKGAVDQLVLSNTKLTRATEGVTSRYSQLRAQIDPTYAAQQRFTRGVKVLDAELKQGNISLSQYNADMKRLRANTTGLVRGSRGVASSFGGMRTAVQQAGYQVGDFAVQVGAGQSALVAFSQQGAQMAGVFGPAGAVVGALIAVGGAIAGGFVRSMGDGTDSVESLAEKTKELTKELNNATEAQMRYIRSQFAEDTAKQERARARMKDDLEFLNIRMQRMIEREQKFGASEEFIKKSTAYQSIAKEAEELEVRIDNATASIQRNEKQLKEYEDQVDGTTDKDEERRRTLENLVETAETQAATIDKMARETAIYKAELLGAGEEEIAAINRAYDRIEAIEEETAARKALMEQTKISAADDPLLGRVAAEGRGAGIIERMKKEARAVELGLDKQLAIEQEHERRVQALKGGYRTGVIDSEQRLNELIILSAKERNAKLRSLEEQRYQFLTENQEKTLGAVGNLFGNLAAIAKEGGEEQFQTWKNMAMAQAAVSTALAVANALTAAPPPFNFALAASVGALGAVQIASIREQEYQGARQMGGQTQPGGQYLVGEDGPEIIRMGGSPGFVTPNHKMGGTRIDQNLVFQLPTDARKEARRVVMESVPMFRSLAKQAVLEAVTQGGSMSRALGRRG